MDNVFANSGVFPSAQFSLLAEFSAWFDNVGDPDSCPQKFVAHLVQYVTRPIFALIDASLNLAAAVVTFPFVAFNITIAKLFGFSECMPECLSPANWTEHVKRVFTCSIAVLASITVGLVYPSKVVALCQNMGINYTWINDPSNLPREGLQDTGLSVTDSGV